MELKLMTANVWADVFGNPVPKRDTALSRMIRRRHPDAVFFQEMHPHWWQSQLSPSLMCAGYRRVEPDLHGNPLNYTPLYYDAARFEALTCGFWKYTGLNDYDSKSVTWALLRARASGCLFGVMATHLYHEQNEVGNAARRQNVAELLQCADEIRAAAIRLGGADRDTAAHMPVFCGGDYNCDVLSEPYAYLEAHGMVDAGKLTSVKVNNVCTYHDYPVYDKKLDTFTSKPSSQDNVYSIDHICVQGNAAVTKYTVVFDSETFVVSDHCAVEIECEI